MRLRVREGKRASPGTAEYEPACDAEPSAQRLDVRHEVPCRVRVEGGMRPAPARAPLIEGHDAIARRVEEASRIDVASASRATVEKQRRLSVWIARLLVVDFVARVDLHVAAIERLHRGV